MDIQAIFGLQFVLSLIVIGLLTKWIWVPWLNEQPRNTALFWLIVPHAFRHLGMVFLVPGVVDQPLPESFSLPAAYGDLAAGILALLALIALRGDWSISIGMVWLFNIVGTVDLLNALRHGDVAPLDLGPLAERATQKHRTVLAHRAARFSPPRYGVPRTWRRRPTLAGVLLASRRVRRSRCRNPRIAGAHRPSW